MNTIFAAPALAFALAACGVPDADVKLARVKLSAVRIAESLVQNTGHVCDHEVGGQEACDDHRQAKVKLESARKDLEAFCAGRSEACQRARRLEGLAPK